MRTVKQVAKTSGVSVCALHNYDHLGLLKPEIGTNYYRRSPPPAREFPMSRRNLFALMMVGATCMFATNLKAAPLPEQNATVTVSGVEIACRFTMPSGISRGAILLVPGSLYSDVDGNYPSMNMRPHTYADLARQLSERGFVVLRMAKIGPGTGSRTIDAGAASRHSQFSTRVEVAAAGLNLLRRTVSIRPLIVAGHSEGAVVASLLAFGPEGASIDGVISLSGPALPILSILRIQVAAMAPPGIAPDMRMFDRTIAAIRAGDTPSVEAKANPQTAMFASMPAQALAYLRSTDLVDPVAALAKVRTPVLIIQGGRDGSVPFSHADMLRAGRGSLPTKVATFRNLTHFYKVAPVNLTPIQSLALDTPTDPAVADSIVGWARRLRQQR